jgi:diacylglycerol O-acyltransferase / wax synthase
MTRSERMSSVDTTWLRMDGPANLMIIVGVWLLGGPVAVEKVEKQIAEGLLSYRRFRQKVDYTPAGVYWRDDPSFDLAHHIKRARLPGRGDKQALQRFVGDLASEPLDPNHPHWTVHIIEDYECGAAVVFCYVRNTEGFRTPALCGRAGLNGAGVRKPRKGGNRGEEGARFGWAGPMGI